VFETKKPDLCSLEPELAALILRAGKGETDVLPALREAFDARPGLWRELGDLGLLAERALILTASGPDIFLREALRRRLHELKGELSEPSDPPAVQLLVQRAALDWLELHYLDGHIAQLQGRFPTAPQVEALERRRSGAHRRYLASIRSLVTVRKLLRPTITPLQAAHAMESRPETLTGWRVSRPPFAAVGVAN
jgi:hypothetical protein